MDVNFVPAAGLANMFAQGVLSNKAGSKQWERGAGFGKVNGNVVRCPAGPLGLAADVGKLVRLRVNINHLHQVNDPIAPGKEAAAVVGASIIHGGKLGYSSHSE